MNSIHDHSYFPHIDGLRALAVLAVLFFHFGTPGFAAGYLGVDIFFVISGFLISRLILKDLESYGQMRFGRFFARRVRRLFPSLAAVCIITALFAYALLDPQRLAAFGKSVGAAVISLSNILFWTEAGYFDAASETKPLLHTWSLGVEEQFYLIWPASLVIAYRFLKHRALAILSISGFLCSIALIAFWKIGNFDVKADSTIFYWMPFRVFEFMMGAIALLTFSRVQNFGSNKANLFLQNLLAILGTTLMLGAMIIPTFTGEPFGPILGFIACLGAVFVILAPKTFLSSSVFEFRPVRWIGQISYSLYLVHWPILIFLPETFQHQPGIWVGLIALSVILTIPIHYLIENPLRRGKLNDIFRFRSDGDLKVFAATAATVVTAGIFVSTAENLPFKDRPFLTAKQISARKQARLSIKRCLIDKFETSEQCDSSRSVQILVIGNSHEVDGFNIFNRIVGNNENVNLINFDTNNDCKYEINSDKLTASFRGKKCISKIETLNRLVEQKFFTHVVYSSNRPLDSNKRNEWKFLEHMKYKNPGLGIIVLSGFLSTKEWCSVIANRYRTFSKCFTEEYIFWFNPQERDKSKFGTSLDYLYINKFDLVCQNGRSETCVTSARGEPFSYDSSHLSLSYAQLIGERIAKRYKDDLLSLGIPVSP